MIHYNPSHKSEFNKVAQIYKDKAFIHDGIRYDLDIPASKTSDRINNVRHKDPIHYLVVAKGGFFMSDKCLTVVQYARRKEIREKELTAVPMKEDSRARPMTMGECEQFPAGYQFQSSDATEVFDGAQVDIGKADEVGQMASVEADDDMTPAPKKAVKPKVPAKPKPAVKKVTVKKK